MIGGTERAACRYFFLYERDTGEVLGYHPQSTAFGD